MSLCLSLCLSLFLSKCLKPVRVKRCGVALSVTMEGGKNEGEKWNLNFRSAIVVDRDKERR